MNYMKNDEIIDLAIKRARETMLKNYGGPFGAVIIDKNGEIISIASNTVLKDNDPTAHAEVNAIREACKKLVTHDLSECILYTTCYPCPMCLSACVWANIKKIYYACTKEDAAEIGFRDDYIYEFIKNDCKDIAVMEMDSLDKTEAVKLFEEYVERNKTIY